MKVTGREARRVLIVEDEVLVAMHLEDLLSIMGHYVVGCVTHVDRALKIASEEDFDFAILDLNLGGERTFPVADVLRGRGIPFLFASGYGPEGLPSEYSSELTLQKPYEAAALARAIESACARFNG